MDEATIKIKNIIKDIKYKESKFCLCKILNIMRKDNILLSFLCDNSNYFEKLELILPSPLSIISLLYNLTLYR